MQVTAAAAVKVNECSLNATCHGPLWGIMYSAYSVVCPTDDPLYISCPQQSFQNILLRQYKYLIMSSLHVKDKFLKFKPTLLFLSYIRTTTLLPEQ